MTLDRALTNMYTFDQDICAVLERKMTLHIHRGNNECPTEQLCYVSKER